MNKIFAICDTDRLYVKNLIQYINSRQNIPLKLQAFTSTELLKQYAEQNGIELLLISAEAMDEEIAGLDIGKIVVLTEDGAIGLKGFPSVNRYQASGNLVQEVMQYYEEGNLAVAYTAAKLASTRLIGIYSPVKRCGKTALSLALGEAYARSRKVLYINLEDFSGFRSLLEREYRMNISDLLYFYREEKQGMSARIEEVAEKLGELYYLPPAMCPADIKSVQPEEWKYWRIGSPLPSLRNLRIICSLRAGTGLRVEFQSMSCRTGRKIWTAGCWNTGIVVRYKGWRRI